MKHVVYKITNVLYGKASYNELTCVIRFFKKYGDPRNHPDWVAFNKVNYESNTY